MGNLLNRFHQWRIDHILLGLILAAPFMLFGYPVIGWIAQSYYFFGREVRDHEIHSNLELPRQWYLGYAIWNWSRDSKLDFFLPFIVNGAIAIAIIKVY